MPIDRSEKDTRCPRLTSVGVRSNLRPASSLDKAVVHPGLDPETAVELIQTVLRLAAYFFAGSALVGLGVYIALLCVEIFSPQPRSKARLAKLPHRLGTAPVAEQNRDPITGDTPTPAEAASVTEEEVSQEGLNSKLLCQQRADHRDCC